MSAGQSQSDYQLLPTALPNLLSWDTRAASLLALSPTEPRVTINTDSTPTT